MKRQALLFEVPAVKMSWKPWCSWCMTVRAVGSTKAKGVTVYHCAQCSDVVAGQAKALSKRPGPRKRVWCESCNRKIAVTQAGRFYRHGKRRRCGSSGKHENHL